MFVSEEWSGQNTSRSISTEIKYRTSFTKVQDDCNQQDYRDRSTETKLLHFLFRAWCIVYIFWLSWQKKKDITSFYCSLTINFQTLMTVQWIHSTRSCRLPHNPTEKTKTSTERDYYLYPGDHSWLITVMICVHHKTEHIYHANKQSFIPLWSSACRCEGDCRGFLFWKSWANMSSWSIRHHLLNTSFCCLGLFTA